MRRMDAGLGMATILLLAGALARWRAAVPAPARVSPTFSTIAAVIAAPSADSLANAAADLVDNDPFRLSNTPPLVRYRDGSGSAEVAAIPVRPRLVLRAIVGGPPWQAVIDGLPGQPASTLAQVGSVFEPLHVRAITRDTVVIQGVDTTWKLGLARVP